MEKRSGLILSLFLVSSFLFAQEKADQRPADKLDRLILELQTDQWLEVPEGIELRPYSPGFSVFYMHDMPLLRENLSFALGYGVSSINVHHNGSLLPDSTNSFVELIELPEGTDYQKNKISASYVDLAAEFRIRTNGLRRLKLMMGARGGFLVNLHSKFKDDGATYKKRDREHALPYHVGLTARVLVGRIGLSAFYGLTPLYQSDRSTELIPVSVGFAFSF